MGDTKVLGIVTVSKRAVAQLAGRLAADCEGVSMLTDRSKRDEVSRFLNGGVKGVYVKRDGRDIVIDVYIICRYGANVAKIREKLGADIKEKIGETGIRIKSVNVYVTGVKQHQE